MRDWRRGDIAGSLAVRGGRHRGTSAWFCLFVDFNFEFGLSRQHCSDMQLLFASPETHAEDSALRVNFVSCSDELEPVIFLALLALGGQLIS